MTLIPIAAFLAGSLLTLLLPVCLLIAITAWFVTVVRRMPGPAGPSETDAPGTPGAEVDKAPHA